MKIMIYKYIFKSAYSYMYCTFFFPFMNIFFFNEDFLLRYKLCKAQFSEIGIIIFAWNTFYWIYIQKSLKMSFLRVIMWFRVVIIFLIKFFFYFGCLRYDLWKKGIPFTNFSFRLNCTIEKVWRFNNQYCKQITC